MFKLLVLLLDDDWGIKQEAWEYIQTMLAPTETKLQQKLIDSVKCTEGRCYLPEDWNT